MHTRALSSRHMRGIDSLPIARHLSIIKDKKQTSIVSVPPTLNLDEVTLCDLDTIIIKMQRGRPRMGAPSPYICAS